jgi:hypothetical protein
VVSRLFNQLSKALRLIPHFFGFFICPPGFDVNQNGNVPNFVSLVLPALGYAVKSQ